MRLSAFEAIRVAINPARAADTLDILRRGLSSDNAQIRAAAARAAARVPSGSRALKELLLEKSANGNLYGGPFDSREYGSLRPFASFMMFSNNFQSEMEAKTAIREALVAIVTSKNDIRVLIDDISERVYQSTKPHFALVPLMQIIGAMAGRYTSLKGLECLLRALRLIGESIASLELGSDVFFWGPPIIMDPDPVSPLQKEIEAVGKRLQGRDVVKCLRLALQSDGPLVKVAVLHALPEFDASVRVELIADVKEIANNDSQRVRDIA